MANATMKISLPEELKREAEYLVTKGHYSSTSSFIQHLIRREAEKKRELERLEKALEKGLTSGVSDQDPKAFFAELRALVRQNDA